MRRAYRWDEDGRVYEVEETWHKGESLGGVVIREDGDGAEYDAESMETLVAVLLALREARPPIEDALLSYNWANGEASALSSDNGGAVLMSWHGDEVVLSRHGVENVLAAIALLYPPAGRKRAPDVKYVALWEPNTCAGECGDKTITHWRPLDGPEVPE